MEASLSKQACFGDRFVELIVNPKCGVIEDLELKLFVFETIYQLSDQFTMV
jgi:hypothetical protein